MAIHSDESERMTRLGTATIEQLLAWHDDIIQELVRRTVVSAAPTGPTAPWDEEHTPREPARARRMEPPKARMAIGAGEDGMGGGPNPLAAAQYVLREPARRPPGTVYATGNTDPELAKQFNAIPARQGPSTYQGGQAATPGIDLDPNV